MSVLTSSPDVRLTPSGQVLSPWDFALVAPTAPSVNALARPAGGFLPYMVLDASGSGQLFGVNSDGSSKRVEHIGGRREDAMRLAREAGQRLVAEVPLR